MKEYINISKILKDKEKGIKLYSPLLGECSFDHIVSSDEEIWVKYKETLHVFDKYGKAYPNGECMLFPSKDMKDWNKFAWKGGDIIQSKDKTSTVVFDSFITEDYTKFRSEISNIVNPLILKLGIKTIWDLDSHIAYTSEYCTVLKDKNKELFIKRMKEQPNMDFALKALQLKVISYNITL